MKTINLILGAQLLAATLAAAVPLADGAVAKTGSTCTSKLLVSESITVDLLICGTSNSELARILGPAVCIESP